MGGIWRRRCQGSLLALLVVLSLCGRMVAQCPVRNPDDQLPPALPTVTSSTRRGEPRLPESGYLSNTSYASTYFGFVFDLPIPLEGHRLMLPLMPPGQHALLAIGFQQGRHSGTLLITASEPPNPVHEMSESERQAEFLAWSKGQPTHQITPPEWMTRTNRFYHISKRTGDVTTAQYWTFVKNYLIRFKVASNDGVFLKKAKQAVDNVRFYCPQEDGTLIDEKGEIVPTAGEGYQGPTIPTSLVDAALDEQPALEWIETGEVRAGEYSNPEMGLKYTYPTEWEALPNEPDPPAKDAVEQRTLRCFKGVLTDAGAARASHRKGDESGGEIDYAASDRPDVSGTAGTGVGDGQAGGRGTGGLPPDAECVRRVAIDQPDHACESFVRRIQRGGWRACRRETSGVTPLGGRGSYASSQAAADLVVDRAQAGRIEHDAEDQRQFRRSRPHRFDCRSRSGKAVS